VRGDNMVFVVIDGGHVRKRYGSMWINFLLLGILLINILTFFYEKELVALKSKKHFKHLAKNHQNKRSSQ
jgi:hypothetical protein